MKQEAGKRIVSKGEYLQAQGKRFVDALGGVCLIIFAVLMAGLALIWGAQDVFALIFLGGGAIALSSLGLKQLQEAHYVAPGIPLTRANTANLPAPDSLVRASQEPLQAQETVLLRAASEGAEAHEEQLLRATTGRQA